ncbi:MAG TPA: A/G-specific adenine glycosylase [Lacipirellulaceae bacterium]|nr:A/G-specific adenine glycosylase [Lacipirellulaceae bacterium]
MAATDGNSRDHIPGPVFTASQRQSLRRRLLTWYGMHKRDLPWRHTRDPYRVWISEIMLQQTRVSTVVDYFERFTRRFPNVRRLAAASETEVLREWEGLGYYRRARQLHSAAQRIAADYHGQFPADPGELQKLPGIGRYTAGAIASIAFDARVPILEANTIRLLSRLIAFRGNPHTQNGQRPLWRLAEELLPQKNVAEFNQALMEVGSLVCTPNKPNCLACPLSSICAAWGEGLQLELPLAKPRTIYRELHEAAVIVRKNGSVLVRQCTADERWAGLWDFPRFAIEPHGPLFAREQLAMKVQSQTGITCAPATLIKTMKHSVTRYRITLACYHADFLSGRVRSTKASPVRWLPVADLPALPLSTTGRTIADLASK